VTKQSDYRDCFTSFAMTLYNMKRLGLILIAVGLALLVFVFYNFIKEKTKMASPIPEDKGVKVIFVTPGSNK